MAPRRRRRPRRRHRHRPGEEPGPPPPPAEPGTLRCARPPPLGPGTGCPPGGLWRQTGVCKRQGCARSASGSRESPLHRPTPGQLHLSRGICCQQHRGCFPIPATALLPCPLLLQQDSAAAPRPFGRFEDAEQPQEALAPCGAKSSVLQVAQLKSGHQIEKQNKTHLDQATKPEDAHREQRLLWGSWENPAAVGFKALNQDLWRNQKYSGGLSPRVSSAQQNRWIIFTMGTMI